MPIRKGSGSHSIGGPALFSAAEIRLLQASYDELWKLRDEASTLFYDRLFDIAPDTRALFSGDMDLQRQQFMGFLGYIVTEIEKPEVVLPALKASAIRHKGYGVTFENYAEVGAALVWMVDQILGPRFKPVWETAYAKISEIMLAEAYPPRACA